MAYSKCNSGLMNRLILAVVLSVSLLSEEAGTISLTGAELLTYPNVSFPTTTPAVDGDSLIFGTDEQNFAKLVSIPLFSTWSGSTTVTRPPRRLQIQS